MPIYKSISQAKAFRSVDKKPRHAIIVQSQPHKRPVVASVRYQNVLKELKAKQKLSTAIPQHAFNKLVKQVSKVFNENIRFQKVALECLQLAAEALLIHLLSDCVLLAEHAKRVTIMDRDMRLLVQILQPSWRNYLK